MNTPFNLNGKVAVVTGAGSGIGKAIAMQLAQQGAQVCLLDLNGSAANEAAKEIIDSNKLVKAFHCNVSVQAEVIQVFNQIATEYGHIDILVNSAGISHIGKLDTTTEADFDRLYQVNIKGVYNAMLGAIPHMKKQKQGVILNLASVAAGLGLNERFAYSMTKGAVLSMTLSVAKDYINEGIRCNCISPGRVHTPFVDGFLKANYPGKEKEMFEKLSKTQPIGRMAKPEEIASLALYLCSDEASFVTGTDYPIDGGFIRLNT
ncbi:MAG TPA: SDR family oxidoreductase [Cyclobacteriaceae bacterium]|nr:SDR family oxidoreductase [Cyclobacteriaceae bacterium]